MKSKAPTLGGAGAMLLLKVYGNCKTFVHQPGLTVKLAREVVK